MILRFFWLRKYFFWTKLSIFLTPVYIFKFLFWRLSSWSLIMTTDNSFWKEASCKAFRLNFDHGKYLLKSTMVFRKYISNFKFCSDLFSLYFAMRSFTLTALLSFWLKQFKRNWKTTVPFLYVFDNFNVFFSLNEFYLLLIKVFLEEDIVFPPRTQLIMRF